MAQVNLCLPLLKYSYADTASTTSPINWTHFSAVDLCVLVQGENSSHGELSLSIVDKTTCMESVDISHYVDWANDLRSSAQKQGTAVQTEQLPIFGITKEALLALRYRLEDGSARRIQLRLEDEAQCHKLVDILQRRGLDFQAQRPRTGRPDTALSRLDTPTTRTTPQGSVQPFHNQVPKSSFQPPRSFGSSIQRPLSRNQPDSTTFSSSPLATPAEYFRGIGQDAQFQSRAQANRSQLLASTKLPGPAPPSFPQHQSTTLGSNMHFSTMSSLPAPRSVSNRDTISEFEKNDRTAISAYSHDEVDRSATESAYAGVYATGTFSSDIPGPPLTSSSSGSRPSASRPGTAGDSTTKATSHSRPNSALELPPLQMPKVLAKATSALQYSIPAPAETGPQAVQTQEQELSTQPQSTNIEVPQSQLASTATLGNDQHTRPNPNSLEQLIFGNRTIAQRQISKSLPRVSSLLDAPHEVEENPEMFANVAAQQSQGQGSRHFGNEQAMLKKNTASANNVPVPAEEISVQLFAAQRPQARDAALNKFMVDHLQDPAFTVLCADVESCWRRIALGL